MDRAPESGGSSMKSGYTQHGVEQLLRRRIAELKGKPSDFGRLHGISQQYLCDVLRRRREPGPKILDALFLYKQVRYFPKIQKRTVKP
ncbi:MAG: hypothetical protein D4R44_06895 [Actinobacteria bacterium]|nr:MAG: hypothetical protein D4R44_06895 [Actinomycetota bacterium]